MSPGGSSKEVLGWVASLGIKMRKSYGRWTHEQRGIQAPLASALIGPSLTLAFGLTKLMNLHQIPILPFLHSIFYDVINQGQLSVQEGRHAIDDQSSPDRISESKQIFGTYVLGKVPGVFGTELQTGRPSLNTAVLLE
jgi:hypothetical protein